MKPGMRSHVTNTRLAVALVMSCALAAATGAARASAAIGCNHAGTTFTITLGGAGDRGFVARSGNNISVLANGTDPVCTGATATVTNTGRRLRCP